MVDANVCEEWQVLITACQLKNCPLHMRDGGVEGTHLETFFIGCLSGVNCARIELYHSPTLVVLQDIALFRGADTRFDL